MPVMDEDDGGTKTGGPAPKEEALNIKKASTPVPITDEDDDVKKTESPALAVETSPDTKQKDDNPKDTRASLPFPPEVTPPVPFPRPLTPVKAQEAARRQSKEEARRMRKLVDQWTRRRAYDLASLDLSAIAGAAGAQLSEMQAFEERPTSQGSSDMAPRRFPTTADRHRTTNPKPSLDPHHRDVWSLVRPSRWKGPEHSAGLLATWMTTSHIANKAVAGPSKSEVPQTVAMGERDREVVRRVQEVEAVMKITFPCLLEGETKLTREWVEYVLGREGVMPFCRAEWKHRAAGARD